MTRVLTVSGFLGVAVSMAAGLYQNFLNATARETPAWMIGGHTHLGVLSILAIVVAFAVAHLGVTGTVESVVTWAFVIGQWGVPLVPWLAGGAGLEVLYPTAFLTGGLLVLSMLLMTWQAAVGPEIAAGGRGGPSASPADD